MSQSTAINNCDETEERTKYKYYADEIYAMGVKGQAAILEDILKSGIPLIFQDDQGNRVQKNPDGTITLLEKKD